MADLAPVCPECGSETQFCDGPGFEPGFYCVDYLTRGDFPGCEHDDPIEPGGDR